MELLPGWYVGPWTLAALAMWGSLACGAAASWLSRRCPNALRAGFIVSVCTVPMALSTNPLIGGLVAVAASMGASALVLQVASARIDAAVPELGANLAATSTWFAVFDIACGAAAACAGSIATVVRNAA